MRNLKKKYKIKFDLLADEEKKFLENIRLGVKKSLWAVNFWELLDQLF